MRSKEDWDLANYWLANKAAPSAEIIKEHLEPMVKNQQKLLTDEKDTLVKLSASLKFTVLLISIIGLILTGIVGWVLYRSITEPINKLIPRK